MDQKFISGNFLPPPRGYPPIALLNNGHDGHHPAVRTSPLTFSIAPAVCWKDVSLKFCSLFPGLKLVSSRQEEGWEVGGGRGNTSFLHQSSLAGSSGAVLTGQHSRLLTDLFPPNIHILDQKPSKRNTHKYPNLFNYSNPLINYIFRPT